LKTLKEFGWGKMMEFAEYKPGNSELKKLNMRTQTWRDI
jgi:hypothetical protein